MISHKVMYPPVPNLLSQVYRKTLVPISDLHESDSSHVNGILGLLNESQRAISNPFVGSTKGKKKLRLPTRPRKCGKDLY